MPPPSLLSPPKIPASQNWRWHYRGRIESLLCNKARWRQSHHGLILCPGQRAAKRPCSSFGAQWQHGHSTPWLEARGILFEGGSRLLPWPSGLCSAPVVTVQVVVGKTWHTRLVMVSKVYARSLIMLLARAVACGNIIALWSQRPRSLQKPAQPRVLHPPASWSPTNVLY